MIDVIKTKTSFPRIIAITKLLPCVHSLFLSLTHLPDRSFSFLYNSVNFYRSCSLSFFPLSWLWTFQLDHSKVLEVRNTWLRCDHHHHHFCSHNFCNFVLGVRRWNRYTEWPQFTHRSKQLWPWNRKMVVTAVAAAINRTEQRRRAKEWWRKKRVYNKYGIVHCVYSDMAFHSKGIPISLCWSIIVVNREHNSIGWITYFFSISYFLSLKSYTALVL